MPPVDHVRRYEVSQSLIRRAIDGGCCGIKAQVNNSTCLVEYPEHVMEWCDYCLMARAAELVIVRESEVSR